MTETPNPERRRPIEKTKWPTPDALAALAAKCGPAKPLAWRRPTDHPQDGFGEEDLIAVADGIGGRYHIRSEKDGTFLLWWAHDEFIWTQHPSENEAKFKAEIDWQARFTAMLAERDRHD